MCSVYSCQLNVSEGLCNTNQEAAFGGKQKTLRINSQLFPQNIWNVCFSEMLFFISAKVDVFLAFLKKRLSKQIKLLWKKNFWFTNPSKVKCLFCSLSDVSSQRLYWSHALSHVV